MNLKSALFTGLILTILFIIMEFVVHGVMLKDVYIQTASLWRPEEEMQSLLYMMLIGEAIFAFFFAIIFAAGYDTKKSGFGQGVRYGLLMACLIAPFSALSWYVILPIDASLAKNWFFADVVFMIVLGLAAGFIYKPNKS